jgi:catechol-2,3-dioxygenase
MSDTIKLEGTTLNAPDALALAQFYAEILGGVASGTSHWAACTGPNGTISFQQVDDFQPPQWPGSDMRMHLDFLVDDLTTTGARVIAAGAKLHSYQPNSDHCYVYTDPAGHLFCLSTWDTATAAGGSLPPGD